jgi:hypothetical protein
MPGDRSTCQSAPPDLEDGVSGACERPGLHSRSAEAQIRCMHPSCPTFHPTTRHAATRAAGLAALLTLLLTACGERTPAVPPLQPQLAEALEMAYRQFADPSVAALEQSCDAAPPLAQALDGWAKAVDEAGLQSRFARETAEAKRRAAAIRSRCPAAFAAAAAPKQRTAPGPDRKRDDDVRPAITPAMLDAYARGLDEEIALMRASGTHSVSLSKYGEQGPQVAAKAGLSLPEYRALRQDMHKVLYERMMHERYAGPAGQARLAQLEPHKRKHAEEVLARDPYASLSTAERSQVQARLALLRSQYDDYMSLAAIAD